MPAPASSAALLTPRTKLRTRLEPAGRCGVGRLGGLNLVLIAISTTSRANGSRVILEWIMPEPLLRVHGRIHKFL
jgi:hypothetical protein